MPEERDERGYEWVRDLRYEEYYYLKDFEYLVVMKIGQVWEAVVFADESCSEIAGRQEFISKDEAQACLEEIMEISLKNRKASE